MTDPTKVVLAPPPDRVPVKRALLSVYDKTGLVELAKGLHALGVELWSSGGTAAALVDAGIPVSEVGDVTGAPEMLGGRVKTLHPRIHGGILADRSNPEHVADMDREGFGYIDLVVVNLYPFLAQPAIETIDIGGPTMIRSAAKNHAHVAVLTDPAAYPGVLGELQFNQGTLGIKTRRQLALDAFAHTAAFDAAVVRWLQSDGPLAPEPDAETTMPRYLPLALERAAVLRYGENPHQQAARYREVGGAVGFHDAATQHGGKELSFINDLDVESAYRTVWAFPDDPACVIVKHANPCGVAVAPDQLEAYRRAFECDSLSAFGGVVAVNRPMTLDTAKAVAAVFTEVVVAPAYEPGAIEALNAKKNLRVLEAPRPTPEGRALDFARIDGGFLVQELDVPAPDRSTWRVVTQVQPTDEQWADAEFAYVVCARVNSNTIVLAKDRQAFGIGAGQQSRVHSAEIAAKKADGRAAGGAAASDAFFPFRDGLDAVAASGVAVVVQPGGSVNDAEVIAAADEHGIAMVFTGKRHFKH
jgi:phosphoribosylaminoimidazolecarboxamide formyltransferase/IMP cyclohydrolase